MRTGARATVNVLPWDTIPTSTPLEANIICQPMVNHHTVKEIRYKIIKYANNVKYLYVML